MGSPNYFISYCVAAQCYSLIQRPDRHYISLGLLADIEGFLNLISIPVIGLLVARRGHNFHEKSVNSEALGEIM